MESVRWMIDLAMRAGVQRIVWNGSFVTDIMEPNDVDCVLLASPILKDEEAEEELQQGLPFLDIALDAYGCEKKITEHRKIEGKASSRARSNE